MPRLGPIKKSAHAHADMVASPMPAHATLPTYSIGASPYIHEFTKFVSRLHKDAPPNVAAEVIEAISATCRQYPSMMQGTSTLAHKQVAPQVPPFSPLSQHSDLDHDNTTDSSPKAETSPSHPTEPSTPSATPGTLSQEPVDVHARLNIDERYIRLGVPVIFQRAFDLLDHRRISYTKNNKRVEVTLTSSQASDIVSVFFSEMFCTTHERVEAIVSNAEGYNTACYADVASVDKSAPTAIQELFSSLSAIARRGTPRALDCLIQNIDSVRLRKSWDKVCVSLASEDDSSHQYIDYLGLKPTRGTTYVSLAKKVLCRKVGISADKFADYLRGSHVPAALTRHFGLGSLLFCPSNKSG